MSANVALAMFLVLFYGGIWAAIKLQNWRAGKSWSDGPSLVPIVPTYPAVAWILGWAVNLFASPWGSWAVVAVHVGCTVYMLWSMGLRQ